MLIQNSSRFLKVTRYIVGATFLLVFASALIFWTSSRSQVVLTSVEAAGVPEDVGGVTGSINLGFNNAEQIVYNGEGTNMIWIADGDLVLSTLSKQSEVIETRILASGDLKLPAIARDGNVLAVGWIEMNERNGKVNVIVSDDGGRTLQEKELGVGKTVSIAASNDTVVAVWHENSGVNRSRILFSTWFGGTWSAPVQVDSSDAAPLWPSIDMSGNDIVVAWRDDREGLYSVWMRRSTDGGLTWQDEQQMTTDLSGDPDVCITSSAVWFVHHGKGNISIKRSDDGGETFESLENLGRGFFPHISCREDVVAVSWEQTTSGPEATDKKAGWALVGGDGTLLGTGAIDEAPTASATVYLSPDLNTMEVFWLRVAGSDPLQGTLAHQSFNYFVAPR
ncbi:MAG: hypothetical protein WC654_04600 [Patescibacteria group bacterium]